MSHPVLLLIRPEQSWRWGEKATCDGTDPAGCFISPASVGVWWHRGCLATFFFSHFLTTWAPSPPSPGCHQPTSSLFISAPKCFPERERTRGERTGNKNLCEHFHEKRECYVENMSRHVSLCWLLWDKLQGETDITGLWTLIISSQVSCPDYLIIFAPIYITNQSSGHTNSRGWSHPSLQTEENLGNIYKILTWFDWLFCLHCIEIICSSWLFNFGLMVNVRGANIYVRQTRWFMILTQMIPLTKTDIMTGTNFETKIHPVFSTCRQTVNTFP